MTHSRCAAACPGSQPSTCATAPPEQNWSFCTCQRAPNRSPTVARNRRSGAGGLTASARPGAEFVVWAAVHGLATLLADGLIRLDSQRAVDREAERLVRAVLTA